MHINKRIVVDAYFTFNNRILVDSQPWHDARTIICWILKKLLLANDLYGLSSNKKALSRLVFSSVEKK